MKKYFITGIVILLPLALTIAIVSSIFNFLTVPFLGVVNSFFDYHHLLEKEFLFFNADQVQNIVAKLLILTILFLLVIFLGLIARWFFFKTFFKFAEYAVKKIPLVRSIYQTCQDVIQTIFTSKTNSFKQVVLVQFPHPGSYCIGLITQEEIPNLSAGSQAKTLAVFVPTTPNPTSGFVLMFQTDDLIYLDMKVEDAFKYIISCGVISPPFKTLSKEEVFLRLKK